MGTNWSVGRLARNALLSLYRAYTRRGRQAGRHSNAGRTRASALTSIVKVLALPAHAPNWDRIAGGRPDCLSAGFVVRSLDIRTFGFNFRAELSRLASQSMASMLRVAYFPLPPSLIRPVSYLPGPSTTTLYRCHAMPVGYTYVQKSPDLRNKWGKEEAAETAGQTPNEASEERRAGRMRNILGARRPRVHGVAGRFRLSARWRASERPPHSSNGTCKCPICDHTHGHYGLMTFLVYPTRPCIQHHLQTDNDIRI